MAVIHSNCRCGYYFTTYIEGEGYIYCPICGHKGKRKFDPETDNYIIIEEEEEK